MGLAGVGGFGASHLKALQQLEAEGLARLACVADPSGDRLVDTRRMLESRGVRWYPDSGELLERESQLDALAIAAPIHLHMEITTRAIVRGLFVYLEKPPVPLIQQLNELTALDFRTRVAVGFQLINSTAVQELKLWRTQGALGDLQSIRVHACSPRPESYYTRTPWAGKMVFDGQPVFDGPATNALSHWLHNVMYVAAEGTDAFALPTEIEAALYRARPIESYDTICMRGQLDCGASFHFVVTHATQEVRPCTLEVIGTKGRAWIVENETTAANTMGLTNSVAYRADPFLESWRQFIRFVSGEEPRVATCLEDTRGYVLATNAALMSSGGIHGVEVPADGGLAKLVERSAKDAKLFSEIDRKWAGGCGSVRTRGMSWLDIGE